MTVSLTICAHNPPAPRLSRVVSSCLSQEFVLGTVEVLLIDNNSSPALILDESFAGRTRVVKETSPGLAYARRRGVQESRGDIIIFVDDDTVLPKDYAEVAVNILRQRPYLGIIGGQLLPEFEGDLPLPERYYWERLALRKFSGDHWSNRWDDFATSPIGGGMVIRRDVALEWAKRFEAHEWRRGLGRAGDGMIGAEDVDQNRTACDMGYGKGIFEDLKVTHVMPRARLQAGFLVRITEGNARSWAFIRGMLNPEMPLPRDTRSHRAKILMESLRRRGIDRHLYQAEVSGARKGWADVDVWRRSQNAT